MKTTNLLLLFASFPFICLCSISKSPNSTLQREENKLARITARTIVPKSFPLSPPSTQKMVHIPKRILKVSKIIRDRAELRVGPASHFKIKNHFLVKNQIVIIFNRHGAWQKVVSIDKGTSGWLHHKTIGKPFLNPTAILIDPNLLPTVFSVRAVKKAFAFPHQNQVPIFIPKGRAFIALNMNKWRTLVWLKETDSVLWLDKQDAR